ncbi:protease SohB [Aliiglaciecola sp. CAU 1673]|uniref:protease SohB n=1 Tax=Aliiglaciecola sp. CAU 1673 TaxID=3032595 RepID=UPI0023DA79EB|nr:protease SohB [Aliiglaciecola sp. CAU 1673]MDF2179970.1 protease SohB [Aliiglaciecola sp. CAU 1673]
MEFLYEYGLFLAKAATLVIALLLAVGGVIALASKQKQNKGELEINNLSQRLDDMTHHANHMILSKEEWKALEKEGKQKQKAEKKQKNAPAEHKPSLFVIDFKGSMDAKEVECLREEVTAILCIAKPEDQVLVRLESGGGLVHGYGLAASQLQRIKDKGIKLTVAVDKVAASGGYMMACVADNLIAAKFAIIGSIGVIAQLPNFNKLLKKHDVDWEQHTAGQFKRTLTVFGENNEAGRQKFREELEEVHVLFKDFVKEHREQLDLDKVATGEYWYGIKAKELNLVDALSTSDDYLLEANQNMKVYQVKYSQHKNLMEKLGKAASISVDSIISRLWQKANQPGL